MDHSDGGPGRLSATQGTALYVGAVLGTGVVTLPALTVRAAGPAALLAWLGLVVLSVPLAASFAALAARRPDAGGIASFVREAYGPTAAAVTGWWYYLAIPVGVPSAALIAGGYVSAVFGGGRASALGTAAVLFALVVAANAFGVRVSGRVQLGLAALLVVALTFSLVVAAPHARPANLHPFAPHGWTAVGTAGVLLLFAFAGWEAVTHLADEFRDPVRDLRRATVAALVVVGVLYLALATLVVLVLGAAAGDTAAPLARILALAVGGYAPQVVAALTVVLTLGTMNAFVAAGSRLGAALGRDGALPRGLGRGSAAGEVPRRSLACLATGGVLVLAVAAVAGGDVPSLVAHLVAAVSGAIAACYAAGMLAAVRLLPRRSAGRRAAAVALLLVLVLVVAAGPYLLFPAAVGAAALAYRWGTSRRRRVRSARPAAGTGNRFWYKHSRPRPSIIERASSGEPPSPGPTDRSSSSAARGPARR